MTQLAIKTVRYSKSTADGIQIGATADVGPDGPEVSLIHLMAFVNNSIQKASTPARPDKTPEVASGKSPTPSDYEYTDHTSGEVFDLADDDRFRRLTMDQFKARKLDAQGIAAVTAYIIGRAKVDRIGALRLPSRMSFINELASGSLDYLNTKNAGQGAGKRK